MTPRVPVANIHWRSIGPQHLVEDAGNLYIIHGQPATSGRWPGHRPRAVAYWSGDEAVAAQHFLAKRAARDHLAVRLLRPPPSPRRAGRTPTPRDSHDQ